MGKLTALKVRTITKPGRYGDGAGLLLNVKPSGAKSWLLRLQAHGRRRDYGLGAAADVSLAEARKRADEYRRLVAAGIDPLTEQGREQIAALRRTDVRPWDDRLELARTRRAATQGDPVALCNLGYMYSHGIGAVQDHAEALRLFTLAAEQGNAAARYNLAGMFASGTGVTRDYAEAERWYRLAAEQGHARAQANLAAMYANGIGVPQNDAKAERWSRMAASQGNADGQYYLGTMYCGRTGLAQDYPQAAKWYRRAAEQGHADAQYILGAMYGNGTGVPQDWVQAHRWFNLAAGSGNAESARNRDAVAARMTPEQLAEAQSLARACEQGYQAAA